jgi:hypothetical protein
LIIAGAVGERHVQQRQRLGRRDRRRERRLAPAGENVENDVGGMDALAHRLGAGGLHGGQSIIEDGGQNLDHLAIAIVTAGELRRTRSIAPGNTQSLNGAPFRSAPGLRARTGT